MTLGAFDPHQSTEDNISGDMKMVCRRQYVDRHRRLRAEVRHEAEGVHAQNQPCHPEWHLFGREDI